MANPDAALRRGLATVHGPGAGECEAARARWSAALDAFLARFGDAPVRLFRAPGRINLRGMHIDTHGGHLNMLTHQRETALVAAAKPAPGFVFVNADPTHPEVRFSSGDLPEPPRSGEAWAAWLARNPAPAAPGWESYPRGAVLRCARFGPIEGCQAAIASDLPAGAALSSSAALCVALVDALAAAAARQPGAAERIMAARDAEWYAGSRCGLSDQAAAVLGQSGALLHVAIGADSPAVEGAQWRPFPEDLRVLVVHSHTRRSISGAQRIAFARNRFAYALAIPILRRASAAAKHPRADALDTLPDFAPADPAEARILYDALIGIPESCDLDALRRLCPEADIEALSETWFGARTPPEALGPIRLRGPLLYGIAEAERARRFPEALGPEEHARLGAWMRIGHDGDRVRAHGGGVFASDCGAAALECARDAGTPVDLLPGAYGASAPALDLLVDAALDGGALGACLTGAGMAGVILALCTPAAEARVRDSLAARLQSPMFSEAAGLEGPLDARAAADSIVANRAPAGAGEFR